MSEPKTRPTDQDPFDFIRESAPERLEDSKVLAEIMERITGDEAVMWGPSIIGYGKYHMKYASGKELDWMLVGFSPRKSKFSVYVMDGFDKRPELMTKLGKFKTGKSCLYINKLSDIDLEVLEEIIRESVAYMRKNYPA